jgi:hypothetical protein
VLCEIFHCAYASLFASLASRRSSRSLAIILSSREIGIGCDFEMFLKTFEAVLVGENLLHLGLTFLHLGLAVLHLG